MGVMCGGGNRDARRFVLPIMLFSLRIDMAEPGRETSSGERKGLAEEGVADSHLYSVSYWYWSSSWTCCSPCLRIHPVFRSPPPSFLPLALPLIKPNFSARDWLGEIFSVDAKTRARKRL